MNFGITHENLKQNDEQTINSSYCSNKKLKNMIEKSSTFSFKANYSSGALLCFSDANTDFF